MFIHYRSKVDQPAGPGGSANTEGEGNDNQNLAAPEDIFKAKNRLGE